MNSIYLNINSKSCDFAFISDFAHLTYISNLLTLILLFKMQGRI